MGLAEVRGDARWEEDFEHQLGHAFILEGSKVDIVDTLDVRNQGGEDNELHLDVVRYDVSCLIRVCSRDVRCNCRRKEKYMSKR